MNSTARNTPSPERSDTETFLREYHDQQTVIVHTAGFCPQSPGRGVYGVVLEYGEHRKEISGTCSQTINKRIKILAAIAGLEDLRHPCTVWVYSDSRFVVDAISKGWAIRWRKNGWLSIKKETVANTDLWQRLLNQCERHSVKFHLLQDGDLENELCQQLAEAAADASIQTVPEAQLKQIIIDIATLARLTEGNEESLWDELCTKRINQDGTVTWEEPTNEKWNSVDFTWDVLSNQTISRIDDILAPIFVPTGLKRGYGTSISWAEREELERLAIAIAALISINGRDESMILEALRHECVDEIDSILTPLFDGTVARKRAGADDPNIPDMPNPLQRSDFDDPNDAYHAGAIGLFELWAEVYDRNE